MRAATRLPAMRARAVGLMADVFTPQQPNGVTVTNGFEVPAYTAKTTTRGKIQGPSNQVRDAATRTVTVGDMELLVVDAGLHIPVNSLVPVAGEYGTGWEYVLTTPGPLTDPALTGSRWLVVSVPAKSYPTARRLDVVRIL